ncbi:MAG: MerR family transcriptional regulator [Gemmobacter sp.]
MDKSPDAFRTISEVAEHLQTPAHVLRFWESRFPQVRPVKRAGGRRYYRPSDVALLAGIRRLLHDEGMTIRGVQKVLREQGVRHVAGLLQEDLDEEAAEMPADADWVEADEAALEAGHDGAGAMAGDAGSDTDLASQDDGDERPTVTRASEPDPVPAEAEPPQEPPAVSAADADHPPAPRPEAEAAPPPLPELPLFAGLGADRTAPPRRPAPTATQTGEDDDTPTLAARLRTMPKGALVRRAEDVAPLRAALADLHARLSDRARGPRR